MLGILPYANVSGATTCIHTIVKCDDEGESRARP